MASIALPGRDPVGRSRGDASRYVVRQRSRSISRFKCRLQLGPRGVAGRLGARWMGQAPARC
jgi:hypothetical protein